MPTLPTTSRIDTKTSTLGSSDTDRLRLLLRLGWVLLAFSLGMLTWSIYEYFSLFQGAQIWSLYPTSRGLARSIIVQTPIWVIGPYFIQLVLAIFVSRRVRWSLVLFSAIIAYYLWWMMNNAFSLGYYDTLLFPGIWYFCATGILTFFWKNVRFFH